MSNNLLQMLLILLVKITHMLLQDTFKTSVALRIGRTQKTVPPTHPKHEELAAGWWSTHSRRREMRDLHEEGMSTNMLYAGQTTFGIQQA